MKKYYQKVMSLHLIQLILLVVVYSCSLEEGCNYDQNSFKKLMLQKIDSLSELYSFDNKPRYVELAKKFEAVYGVPPQYFARAPGRVNIIGEHIDYMGYGVLPFALETDTLIAVALDNTKELTVSHVEPIYPTQSVRLDFSITHQFNNSYLLYVWAGIQAAAQENPNFTFGMKWLITGNIPISAGLSSSSALVVCSGIATLRALNIVPDQTKFVENLIKYERLAGTACGGMDQSISALGKKGQALYIEFNPLRLAEVPLPKGYMFVIADSMTESTKLQTAGTRYNKRVCECKVAVALICKKLGINYEGLNTLHDLQIRLNVSLETMQTIVRSTLHEKRLLFEEIETELNVKLGQFLSDIPMSDVVLQQNTYFEPYKRALHVVEEANRVIKFKDICFSQLNDDAKAILLGQLMNQSQESCAELYECSSENINQVTQIARSLGALGSRLTGAGWGGCTVSLVHEKQAEEFVKQFKAIFQPEKQTNATTFISQPSNGAVTIDLQAIL